MPTGGGKSLTFQLPAALSSGITVVIMPLISLIYDQIQRLNELGIPARDFNSNQQLSEQNDVYDEIIRNTAIKILFITPEKLSQSDKLNWFLHRLEERGKLSRIVIDEAHCVSQWGRDFRKDYLKISKFRDNFPNIPILALTGTATHKVREDVVKSLKMRQPLIFLSSFNRPNLFYQVKTKTSNTIVDIASLIKQKYMNSSGLIYCVTKKDCVKVAERLRKLDIRADFYHSEVDPYKKTQVQDQWMSGEIKVLVATVAFGMGIDKQAVRFVFHYSFPKSLENYYQESGRAGRDGIDSLCVIYYKYSDKQKQDYLISLNPDNAGQNTNYHELQFMVSYCEDVYTCRRKLQLNYFGEEFDSKECRFTCDNCKNARTGCEKDVSEGAKKIIEALMGDRACLNTLLQIAGFMKGKVMGKKKKNGRDMSGIRGFGELRDEKLEDIEKVIRKMVELDVLRERSVTLFKKNHMVKIDLGPNHRKVLEGGMKVLIMSENNRAKTKETVKATNNASDYDFNNHFPDFDLDELKYVPACSHLSMNSKSKPLNTDNSPPINPFPLSNIDSNVYGIYNIDNTIPPSEYLDENISNAYDFNDFYPEINFEDLSVPHNESPVPDPSSNPPLANASPTENPIIRYTDTLKSPSPLRISDNLLSSIKYGNCGGEDAYDEIYSRLVMVRSRLARQSKKAPESILTEGDLERLCKELPKKDDVPIEFLREIQYFKCAANIRETFEYELDLENIDFESLGTVRKGKGYDCNSSEKKVKYS